MRLSEISRTIQVPEDVTIKLQGKVVSVKGEKGSLIRDFSFAPISIDTEGQTVRISAKWPRKKESALVGTIYSHIQNMITGVTKGYSYKLKIVFSHFPINVKLEGKKVLIENFTGERKARHVKIIGDVKVKLETEDIIISGINLEEVSQTAANIEQASRVKGKDARIFLDGLYVYERNEGMA
ncbi:MAG: 50S ribosomal protein L6 [Nitrososphaerota archaeon]|jgi:large subunit ribosomal protein L6|uniref:50S ribosomal protein L6 n=1 Tax=Candidatus Bathycorpusculum sp. TaxID=2994959 RepID=UPI002816B5B8|nr:50S ribosomal protein L6 [Candidatus Termiticorpusculum sp.]MCL2257571.1 50S ribosomal protein L6 [Candidatus Termiticorpusculum sp.]MCL2292294.1 50S ribosomal protein L6 [Candidatus Termiticorpusculum sp.]MDR0461260.1 50S ribosomal protein L6 [Nitrososphaerota archaeon]